MFYKYLIYLLILWHICDLILIINCCSYEESVEELDNTKVTLNKTRTRTFCCKGYKEFKENDNMIQCYPECKTCLRGHCSKPNKCECYDGYFGENCTQRCRRDKWGKNCLNDCKCRNNALCDHKTGQCRCLDGWIGIQCDKRCSDGYYGTMCKKQCSCGSTNRCNPIDGECLFQSTNKSKIESTINTTTQRITVTNWVRVDKFNEDTRNNNNHSVILNAINSTLANITENIEKLAKTVEEQNQQQQDEKDEQLSAVLDNLSTDVIQSTRKNDLHFVYETDSDNVKIYNAIVAENLVENTGNESHPMKSMEHFISTFTPGVTILLLLVLILTIILIIKMVQSLNYIKRKPNPVWEPSNWDVTYLKEENIKTEQFQQSKLPDIPMKTDTINQSSIYSRPYEKKPEKKHSVGNYYQVMTGRIPLPPSLTIVKPQSTRVSYLNAGAEEEIYEEIDESKHKIHYDSFKFEDTV